MMFVMNVALIREISLKQEYFVTTVGTDGQVV